MTDTKLANTLCEYVLWLKVSNLLLTRIHSVSLWDRRDNWSERNEVAIILGIIVKLPFQAKPES